MSSGPSAPSGEPRLFTLPEARRTLPLVRRIVQDIVDVYQPARNRLDELHRRLRSTPPDAAHTLDGMRREVEEELERVRGFVAELQEIGCLFKGFDDGLVDYFALFRGRSVCLCWRLGEEDIEWWHEVDGGFAGRRRITPEMADELAGGAVLVEDGDDSG